MQNVFIYIIIVILILIVIGYIIQKQEPYQPIEQTNISDQILQPLVEGPQMEMQIGTTTLTQQMIDSTNADQIAQREFSGNITKEMEEMQLNQIRDSEINEQTTSVQQTNQAVSNQRLNAIFDSGMTKRGGLTEVESNRLAATTSYMQFDSFEGGVIHPEYENILERKQNSKMAITTNNVILNAFDNQPYVPNVGTGSNPLIK